MRARIRFSELGKVRFISHRDVARIWERAFRKAGLAVAYSEGFSPRPRLHFGLALSNGHESSAEYLDADLVVPELPVDLAERLNAALPEGIAVTAVGSVSTSAPSLQDHVESCSWEISLGDASPGDLSERVTALREATTFPITIERKGKQVVEDLRPLVLELTLVAPAGEDGPVLLAELGTKPRSVRPSELMEALGVEPTSVRVRRTAQWITVDGHRCEPLSPGVPGARDGAPPEGSDMRGPHDVRDQRADRRVGFDRPGAPPLARQAGVA